MADAQKLFDDLNTQHFQNRLDYFDFPLFNE